MKHPELPDCHSCRRMPTKPAVREPLVPRPPARELLYLQFPAEQDVKQADTVRCPVVYSAELPAEQSDTVRCPAVYSAELPAGQADTGRCPAVYSVRTAEDSPAEHSVHTAEGNPAEHSVRTAEGSPAEHSADRKADKGCTEVLPQVRPHLL